MSNKFLLIFSVLSIILLVMFLSYALCVNAITIITEDDYESDSVLICEKLFNSTNQSDNFLNCLDHFLFIRNQTGTIQYINQSLDEDDIEDYIEDKFDHLDINDSIMTIDTWLIQRDDFKQNFLDEINLLIDERFSDENLSANTQVQLDHEFRMKQLEFQTDITDDFLNEDKVREIVINSISSQLASVPPSPPPATNNFGFDTFDIVLIVGVLGIAGYFGWKQYTKRKLPDFSEQSSPQEKKVTEDYPEIRPKWDDRLNVQESQNKF